MKNERGNMLGKKLRTRALAFGLGLAALLPGSVTTAHAEDILKPTFGGIGYKEKAMRMSYQDVIKSVSTPKEAIFYRDNCIPYADDEVTYGVEDYWASFKQIHQKGKDDCDGVAYAMAALLADDGYTPQVLWLKKKVTPIEQWMRRENHDTKGSKREEDSHLVYPYQDKQTGKWGCIGVCQLEDRDPKYDTIEAMVKTLKIGYLPNGYEVDSKEFSQGLQNLDKSYGRELWVSGDGNMKDYKRTNVAGGYDPKVYIFMRERLEKQGYKAASETALVTEAVKSGLCSAIVAEKHYDMAYSNVRQEVASLMGLTGIVKENNPIVSAAKSMAARTDTNQK